MDNEREMIEKALVTSVSSYVPKPDWLAYIKNISAALAEQAIVIECEVEHRSAPQSLWAYTWAGSLDKISGLAIEGHHGTPGKAIAIIVPLEEDAKR